MSERFPIRDLFHFIFYFSMPDKDKFVEEMVRVCSPGGRLIIVTWCHRELQPGESTLKPEEQHLLNKINDGYIWLITVNFLTSVL